MTTPTPSSEGTPVKTTLAQDVINVGIVVVLLGGVLFMGAVFAGSAFHKKEGALPLTLTIPHEHILAAVTTTSPADALRQLATRMPKNTVHRYQVLVYAEN